MAVTDAEIKEAKENLLKATRDADAAKAEYTAKMAEFGEKTDKQRKEIDDLTGRLSKREREIDEMMEKLARPGFGGMASGSKEADEKALKAFQKFSARGESGLTTEEKSLIVSDATQGGMLVPTVLSNRIIEKVVRMTALRQLCRVDTIGTDSLELPRETGQLSAGWVAETGTRSETTGTALGLEKVAVHEAYALVKPSMRLLEDNVFNFESWLSQRIGKFFAKLEGTAFLLGTGVGQPKGILLDAGVLGTQSTTSAGFKYDDLLTVEYLMPEEYALPDSVAWLMNRQTVGYVRSFKADGSGEYLVTPAFVNMSDVSQGKARRIPIDGYDTYEAFDMATVASAAKVGVFGNFTEGYQIVDRLGMLVIRDIYSSKNSGLVELQFRKRVGGGVVQPDALRYLQCGA